MAAIRKIKNTQSKPVKKAGRTPKHTQAVTAPSVPPETHPVPIANIPLPTSAPAPASAPVIDPALLEPSPPMPGPSMAGNQLEPTRPSLSGASRDPASDLALLLGRIKDLEAQVATQHVEPIMQAGPSRAPQASAIVPAHTIWDNSDVPTGSVPKPRGSAGGGQNGYHLKVAIGLNSPEGSKLYNMTLSTIRQLMHASRIDTSQEYRHIRPEDLSRIFSAACQIHPYLARFKRDWATVAMVKQYLSSVRRYGKRKGYFNCAEEARSGRDRNLDDEMDN